MSADFTVIIPARYDSMRLPGKPLLEIAGKPMIRHVWERARESGAARVIVATDDKRILAACDEFGADAIMTSKRHASGTDRVREAAAEFGLSGDEVVVNVQGDEPLMPLENIRQAAELAMLPETDIATLHAPVKTMEEFLDPNAVKLVTDRDGRVLYFSRAPIPWHREGVVQDHARQSRFEGAMRHLGIYAYRFSALERFSRTVPCTLEEAEKLEQLRALWLGMYIRSAIAAVIPPAGVDTEADLERVRKLFAGN